MLVWCLQVFLGTYLQNGHAYKDKWGLLIWEFNMNCYYNSRISTTKIFVKRAHYKKFCYINFSRAIKSIVTLKNGSKIIKWWDGSYSNGGISWAWWLEVNGEKSRRDTLTWLMQEKKSRKEEKTRSVGYKT